MQVQRLLFCPKARYSLKQKSKDLLLTGRLDLMKSSIPKTTTFFHHRPFCIRCKAGETFSNTSMNQEPIIKTVTHAGTGRTIELSIEFTYFKGLIRAFGGGQAELTDRYDFEKRKRIPVLSVCIEKKEVKRLVEQFFGMVFETSFVYIEILESDQKELWSWMQTECRNRRKELERMDIENRKS